jgi:hypothetical protein
VRSSPFQENIGPSLTGNEHGCVPGIPAAGLL